MESGVGIGEGVGAGVGGGGKDRGDGLGGGSGICRFLMHIYMAREQQVRRVKGRGERDRHGGDGRWIKRAGMWRGEGRGIRIRWQ